MGQIQATFNQNRIKLLSVMFLSAICFSLINIALIISAKLNKSYTWFLTSVASSMIFFIFLAGLQFIIDQQKTLLENNKSKENDTRQIQDKKNLLIFGVVGTILKSLAWATIMKINTSLSLSPISILSLFFLVSFIHFHHIVLTKGLFGKLSLNNNGKIYLLELGISSLIIGIPLTMIRMLLPQVGFELPIPESLRGFYLFGRYINIFNEQNALLSVCIIDCLCLIFGFILIEQISNYLLIEYTGRKEIKEKAHNDFKENHKFDIKALIIKFSLLSPDNSDSLFNRLITILKDKNGNEANELLFEVCLNAGVRKKFIINIREFEINYNKIQRSDEEKKIFKIAVNFLKKQVFIVSNSDKIKEKLKIAGLSILSTIIFHAFTQIQSSITYDFDLQSLAILAIVSSVILTFGFLTHMIVGNLLTSGENIFGKIESNWYSELQNNTTLWDKMTEKSVKHCGDKCSGYSKERDGDQKDANCRCDKCCAIPILKEIALHSDDQLIVKKIILLLDQASKEPAQDNGNGGGCPCSVLAKKASKDIQQEINDRMVDIALEESLPTIFSLDFFQRIGTVFIYG